MVLWVPTVSFLYVYTCESVINIALVMLRLAPVHSRSTPSIELKKKTTLGEVSLSELPKEGPLESSLKELHLSTSRGKCG